MDDDDAKHILLSIRRSVLEHYPFKNTGPDRFVDARYAMTFGLIAGLCTEGLQAVAQDRPIRIRAALSATFNPSDLPPE